MERPDFASISNHGELRALIREYVSLVDEERRMLDPFFGEEFLRLAEHGYHERVAAFIDEGFPLDYQDRRNGETALHYAAASDARDVVRVILESGKCDFLIRDNWGRLASEVAYLSGDDPALSRLLACKERKQAAAQGIKLTRRPEPVP